MRHVSIPATEITSVADNDGTGYLGNTSISSYLLCMMTVAVVTSVVCDSACHLCVCRMACTPIAAGIHVDDPQKFTSQVLALCLYQSYGCT